MSVLKEWKCQTHGEFEGSHPICPALGCNSKHVSREIRTAPGFRSGRTKQTDAGIKDLVDGMGLGNIRSPREGEASYGGNVGSGLLWGDNVQKVLKQDLGSLVSKTAQPFTMKKSNGQSETVPHGMRLAAKETSGVLLPAKLTVSKDEGSMSRTVQANS